MMVHLFVMNASKRVEQASAVSVLPDEIFEAIFSHLTALEKARVAGVCRLFRDIAYRPRELQDPLLAVICEIATKLFPSGCRHCSCGRAIREFQLHPSSYPLVVLAPSECACIAGPCVKFAMKLVFS